MARNPNTTAGGGPFTRDVIDAVWSKGKQLLLRNPALVRRDACNALMDKASYGTAGDRGWEIDHIKPVSKGGTDALVNLQPLHWRNNRGKGDDYPDWNCTISDS